MHHCTQEKAAVKEPSSPWLDLPQSCRCANGLSAVCVVFSHACSPLMHPFLHTYLLNFLSFYLYPSQYVREFDQLKWPQGPTVASNGRVLVADSRNNCIAAFDKKGELVHSIAVEDPTGLATDSRGDLLVASYRKKCVYYF